MDVLEDEQRRLLARGLLDEAARREEEALAVDRALRLEAEEEREVLRQLVVAVGDGAQLLAHDVRVLVVEDLRDLLHVLREGAVRRAVAVRRRPAAQRPSAFLLDDVRELLGEPALADPGRADDGDEVRTPLLAHLLPQPAEDLELARAADERRLGERALPGRRLRRERPATPRPARPFPWR